jgi:type VI secretion system protein ImpJ
VLAPGSGGVGEWSEFLMLQILNRHEPLLNHVAGMPILHPETLFRLMLGLAGELATYVAQDKRVAEYPAYDHELPGIPFLQLMDYLRDALSAAVARKAIQLEIQDRGYGIRTVAIPDAKLVTSGRFVIAAKGPMAPEELGTVFPMRLKLGPVEDIVQLVRRNLPGVRVRLVPHRPEEIPYHAGFIYFGLDTNHDLWSKVGETQEFAFHIGGDVRGIDLEMWVIKGEN